MCVITWFTTYFTGGYKFIDNYEYNEDNLGNCILETSKKFFDNHETVAVIPFLRVYELIGTYKFSTKRDIVKLDNNNMCVDQPMKFTQNKITSSIGPSDLLTYPNKVNYITNFLYGSVLRKLHKTERWSVFLPSNTTYFPLNSYKNYIIFFVAPFAERQWRFICQIVNLSAKFITVLVLENYTNQTYDMELINDIICIQDFLIISWNPNDDEIYLQTCLFYEIPGKCEMINNITYLDTWIQDNNGGSFLKNAELRPITHPKVFECCKFEDVSVFEFPPYTFIKKHSDEIAYDGVDIRLINIMNDVLTTSVNCTETGAIYITNTIRVRDELETYHRPLYPYHSLKYMYFVPKASTYPRWGWFTTVFSNSLWLCYLASLVAVTITLKCIASSWFIEEGQSFRNTSFCLMYTWSICLNYGVKNIPKSINIRFVLLSWIVYSVSVSTVFQTFVTSYFVFQLKEHQIDTIEELQTEGYSLVFDSKIKNIIHHSNNSFYFQSPKEAFLFVLNTPKTALYTSEEFFKYNVETLCTNVEINAYHMLRKYEDSSNFNGLITRDIFLQNKINEILKRLSATGIVKKIFDDIVNPTGRRLYFENGSRMEYQLIDLLCLQSCFYFFIFGISLSVILFLLEIVCKPSLINSAMKTWKKLLNI
ncbi:hypothetical protein C0J52_20508 [Blattella germanica]|nr:hypothetical protein C0J52_20508 [Blattella germanica]